jgi:hypothetical protein
VVVGFSRFPFYLNWLELSFYRLQLKEPQVIYSKSSQEDFRIDRHEIFRTKDTMMLIRTQEECIPFAATQNVDRPEQGNWVVRNLHIESQEA